MSLRPLHLLGSPILRQHSAGVGTVDDAVRRLVDDMFETMDAAHGVGLAANQVGLARRVAVIDADGDRFAMIDPVIVETEGRSTAEEGCLSIPEIFGDVSRPERVVIEALDQEGQRYRREATGLKARIDARVGRSSYDPLYSYYRHEHREEQAEWRRRRERQPHHGPAVSSIHL